MSDGIDEKRNPMEAFRKSRRLLYMITRKQPKNWQSAISAEEDAREIS